MKMSLQSQHSSRNDRFEYDNLIEETITPEGTVVFAMDRDFTSVVTAGHTACGAGCSCSNHQQTKES
jgi:hypothetical protein